ncbi:MAG: radical SAM protein [Labilithrix sp.]|nr:radical SAM protein [Labilithrix sp.]
MRDTLLASAAPRLGPHASARTMVALPVLQSRPSPATPPRSVRLSLTDRCDLACVYCRPDKRDGYLEDRLEIDAWKTMASGLVRAGVRRVRLTGGEPLLHPAVVEVVAFLGTLGLDDLALTTNATRLERHARALREAGLRRVNVSLDTLDPARFRRMTRGGKLDVVLRGVDAALAAGFDEIKLNAVVLRGENDAELENIVRWSWERGIVPRFLEVMHIGEGAKLKDRVVRASEMRARLAHLLANGDAVAEADRGPAKYLFARHEADGPGRRKVGFITGTSDTYCKGCDRLRVAADGTLRPCLATNDGLSAGHIARGGDPSAIAAAVDDAWRNKPDGDVWKGCTEPDAASVSMRGIGG